MLKAIVQYSKKIPAETQYSSEGYSLSLEAEIPETDPAAIHAKLSDTFRLVKSHVEQELANGNGKPVGLVEPASSAKPHAGNRLNGVVKATNRQIKFITDLAGRQGVALSDLNGRIRERFGVEGLYDLDKKQASTVLDLLNGVEKKAA
jgi:hypothetical protein